MFYRFSAQCFGFFKVPDLFSKEFENKSYVLALMRTFIFKNACYLYLFSEAVLDGFCVVDHFG